MLLPQAPKDEAARQTRLDAIGLLDTDRSERFDRLTKLVSQILEIPIALISLVDRNRQWFKSKHGIDVCETERSISFCAHVVSNQETLLITDTLEDPRFVDNPLVTGSPYIRFYAGVPLILDGFTLGTLCVIDHKPRTLPAHQLQILELMARIVVDECQLWELIKQHEQQTALQLQQEHYRQKKNLQLQLINQAQKIFLQSQDVKSACSDIFDGLLNLVESQFGFIGQVFHHTDGTPFLRVHHITDISWNALSRAMYRQYHESTLDFHNLDNLFGQAVLSNTEIITNDPAQHPFSRGVPEGHPTLHCFLGIPLRHAGQVKGMMGFANKPGGYSQADIEWLTPISDTLGLLFHARNSEEARLKAESELKVLATRDPLTSLFNRRAFIDQCEERLEAVAEGQLLVMLDLDHFKQINDTYGHAAGDAVLRHVSQSMQDHLRQQDLLGRLGGEEFAILLTAPINHDSAERILARLHQVIAESPIVFGSQEISVTASAGTALQHTGDQLDDLLSRADASLYQAKAEGRNRICGPLGQ